MGTNRKVDKDVQCVLLIEQQQIERFSDYYLVRMSHQAKRRTAELP